MNDHTKEILKKIHLQGHIDLSKYFYIDNRSAYECMRINNPYQIRAELIMDDGTNLVFGLSLTRIDPFDTKEKRELRLGTDE